MNSFRVEPTVLRVSNEAFSKIINRFWYSFNDFFRLNTAANNKWITDEQWKESSYLHTLPVVLLLVSLFLYSILLGYPKLHTLYNERISNSYSSFPNRPIPFFHIPSSIDSQRLYWISCFTVRWTCLVLIQCLHIARSTFSSLRILLTLRDLTLVLVNIRTWLVWRWWNYFPYN